MSNNLKNDILDELHNSKTLTFCQLFSDEQIDYIEIPIIQRDYAQGRKNVADVRDEFVKTFKDTLSKTPDELKQPLDLDFIYGSIQTIKENNMERKRFSPLDGQQRLTTIFLLHWYIACKEDRFNEFQALMKIDKSSRFTYQTRTSSSEFFDTLVQNQIKLSELLEEDTNRSGSGIGNTLSKTIKNCQWFYLSWDRDPTIQSVLVMLDEIHKHFAETNGLYDRLIDVENKYITFQFLNLKDFGLSDDLYIKMNSRGKPLTSFENFKAKLERLIGKLDWGKQRKLVLGNIKQDVSTQEYFSHKIDTEWANIFWGYRNISSYDSSFDDELMNFFRVIMANEYTRQFGNDDNQEFLIGTKNAQNRDDYTDIISYYLYEKFKILNKESIEYLINILDSLDVDQGKLKCMLMDSTYFNEEDIFEKVLKHNINFEERIQFYAYCLYLIKHSERELNIESISDWMRIIVNLSVNTRYDRVDDFTASVESLQNLLVNSSDILSFLRSSNAEIRGFNQQQVREEKIKALLLKKSEEWKNAILKAERHGYLKGQIEFILKFSGILDFYIENENCEWDDSTNAEFMKKFSKYFEKADAIFDSDGLKSNLSGPYGKTHLELGQNGVGEFLWERAMLAIGNYLMERSSWRYNFLFSQHRDLSWKRLLNGKGFESGLQHLEDNREIIKKLFDKLNVNDIERSLSDVINSNIVEEEWMKMLIVQPELFHFCGKRNIRIESQDDILLLSKDQMNSKHVELFTYYLMHNLLIPMKERDELGPYLEVEYEFKYNEDRPYLYLTSWEIHNTSVDLDIYFIDGEYNIDLSVQRDNEFPTALKNYIMGTFSFEEDSENRISLKTGKDNIKEQLLEVLASLKAYADDKTSGEKAQKGFELG